MRRSPAKFSESEVSIHTLSLADFTTTTPELKFSVHTGIIFHCLSPTLDYPAPNRLHPRQDLFPDPHRRRKHFWLHRIRGRSTQGAAAVDWYPRGHLSQEECVKKSPAKLR